MYQNVDHNSAVSFSGSFTIFTLSALVSLYLEQGDVGHKWPKMGFLHRISGLTHCDRVKS